MELGIDVNTADMHYSTWTILNGGEYILSPNQGETIEELQEDYGNQVIPAWSLSALLGLIPNWQMQTQDIGIGILFGCKECIKIIDADIPINAAFEMICWLKENNKI
jgi:hypothetical protein